MDQLPRLGKRELICLLLFICNNVVFVWRGFLFPRVLWMGYVILLWHSLSLPYDYFILIKRKTNLNIAFLLENLKERNYQDLLNQSTFCPPPSQITIYIHNLQSLANMANLAPNVCPHPGT